MSGFAYRHGAGSGWTPDPDRIPAGATGIYPYPEPDDPVVHLTGPIRPFARCGHASALERHTRRPADVTCGACISRMTEQERFERASAGTAAP